MDRRKPLRSAGGERSGDRVTAAAVRVCHGMVLWVANGAVRDGRYLPACEGLVWEWSAAYILRRECASHGPGLRVCPAAPLPSILSCNLLPIRNRRSCSAVRGVCCGPGHFSGSSLLARNSRSKFLA